MGRWRSRLAELQNVATITPTAVQTVQKVQKSDWMGDFEPIEPFEPPGPVDVWSEDHEERAAIAEQDGGVPREWAEALARLDPARPPGDVPMHGWVQFIDDCGRFLDQGWAAQCNALGWHPLDLFGCDRERPWARIDHAGLLWLLAGRKLVALTADTATIEGTTGGPTTYYRRTPIEPGCIAPVWELR